MSWAYTAKNMNKVSLHQWLPTSPTVGHIGNERW